MYVKSQVVADGPNFFYVFGMNTYPDLLQAHECEMHQKIVVISFVNGVTSPLLVSQDNEFAFQIS